MTLLFITKTTFCLRSYSSITFMPVTLYLDIGGIQHALERALAPHSMGGGCRGKLLLSPKAGKYLADRYNARGTMSFYETRSTALYILIT